MVTGGWWRWLGMLVLVGVLCLGGFPGISDEFGALAGEAGLERRIALAVALAASGGAVLLRGTEGDGG
jgi:hypothetical protein